MCCPGSTKEKTEVRISFLDTQEFDLPITYSDVAMETFPNKFAETGCVSVERLVS